MFSSRSVADRFVPDYSTINDRIARFQYAYEISPTHSRNILFPTIPKKRFDLSSTILCENPFYNTCSLNTINTTWKIPQNPYKVLDAPKLSNDYYSHVLDWSIRDELAVSLGSCVYIYDNVKNDISHKYDLSSLSDLGTSVQWHLTSEILAIGTYTGHVQLWDVRRATCVRTVVNHDDRVGTLAWNGENIITSGSRDHSIVHYDKRVKNLIHSIHKHDGEVCCLKWERNKLASGGNDDKLIIWDGFNQTPYNIYSEHNSAVRAIAWSPTISGLIASGGGKNDCSIRVWNTTISSSKSLKRIMTGFQNTNLLWSSKSDEILCTTGANIMIWKYPTMRNIAILTGHDGRILYSTSSPCNRFICTGSGLDETLRFWHVFNV